VAEAVGALLSGKMRMRSDNGEARFQDGQRIWHSTICSWRKQPYLCALQDYLAGQVRAPIVQWRIGLDGAGSTGWISSVFNMTQGIATAMAERRHSPSHAVEDPRLFFVARNHSSASTQARAGDRWIADGRSSA